MKQLFLGLISLCLLGTPAAHAQTPGAPPHSAREALLGYKWSWSHQPKPQPGEEVTFFADGHADRNWPAKNTWTWEAVDTLTFAIVAHAKKTERFVLTFDPSFTRFETTNFFGTPATGTRLGALAQTPASQPVVSSPGLAATLPSPDSRSQLANFWKQIPNAAAWSYSSLDLSAPVDLGDKLTVFKRGLFAESSRNTGGLQKAYQRAIGLTDMMGGAYAQRLQILRQASGPGGALLPAAITQWAGLANSQRLLFRSPRAILDEAVFAGGGLGKAIPVINATFPLAVVPPAPASAMLHDYDANPAWVRCSGNGPSGTNFGWGDRRMKLGVEVHSNSDVPIPVTVDAYWVGWDGKQHHTMKAGHADDSVSGTHPISFEVGNTVQRNNGQTYGVQDGSAPAGVYRGWVITIHDKSGKNIGTAANVSEFNNLVK